MPDSGLERNENIILYSEGGIHSAQAWFLLEAMGYKSVYMLLGGLDDWKDLILFPAIPANPGPEQQAAFARMKELSKFFGATPRSGTATIAPDTALPLPKLQMSGSQPGTAAAPKKKKEGC